MVETKKEKRKKEKKIFFGWKNRALFKQKKNPVAGTRKT